MATSTRKSSSSRSTAQKRAAEKAEEVANALHSFAARLTSLDLAKPKANAPTPRNWWLLQAGKFKNDSTFADFVAQVQAARRQEG